MVVGNRRKIVAAVTAAVVLLVGAGTWRFAVLAGQKVERPQEKPAHPTPAMDIAPKVMPRSMPASRTFQIDLKIVEKKEGRRTVVSTPRLLTLEGRPAQFTVGESRTIQLGGGMTEEVVIGPKVCAVVRLDRGEKVRLDLTVRRPSQETVYSRVLSSPQESREDFDALETKTLRLLRTMTLGEPVTFEMNYKGSSELLITATVCEIQKEAAAKEKPPARVGQIIMVGLKKIPEVAILEQLPFAPGQILTFPDLQTAEENLARLKGLKSKPTVAVLDREGDGVFKDIQITVEEK